MITMDELDKRLLNHIQGEFPMAVRPFAALGESLGIPEDEALERTRRLKEAGAIRQISAIFDTRALGYQSSLVAMRVPPKQLNAAAAVINSHPGVSHNYKRNNAYNLWFTIALPQRSDLQATLDRLHELAGAESTRYLPTLKLFKIGVRMDLTGEEGLMSPQNSTLAKYTQEDRDRAMRYQVTERDIVAVRALQEDLPMELEPYAAPAAAMGVSQEELLAEGHRLQSVNIMRRFAAILYHRKTGFTANAMGVWAVPPEDVEAVGALMAQFNAVSHCYLRPTYEDWPYNVFSMIHGRKAKDCQAVVDAIAEKTGIQQYDVLYSTKEYKKVRVRYFSAELDEWELTHLPSPAGAR